MNGATSAGALLERLQHEHHELNCQLLGLKHELEDLASSRHAAARRLAISDGLVQIAAHVAKHFAEKEEGGAFEEALTRCPSLSAKVNALIGEHTQLLSSMRQLAEDLKRRRPSPQKIRNAFEHLADTLRCHEARESQLLEMALGGEASEYDVEGND